MFELRGGVCAGGVQQVRTLTSGRWGSGSVAQVRYTTCRERYHVLVIESKRRRWNWRRRQRWLLLLDVVAFF